MGSNRARAIKIILTVLLIAACCFLPVFLLVQNAVQSSHRESLTSARTLGSPDNGYFGAATPVYSSSGSNVCVAFEFLGFDPSTSFASFATVVSATSAGAGYIQREIKDGYGTGVLVMRSYFGLSSIMVPFPLADLTTGSLSTACTSGNSAPYMRGVGFREEESSYLLGQPRAFPNDWYEFDDTIGVYLCAPKQSQAECTAQLNLQSEVSMVQLGTPSVIATTRDADLAMTTATGGSTVIAPNLVELRFVLHRPGWFAGYTYLIAAMPFLLIFGLFAVYVRRSARDVGGRVEYSPERAVPNVHEIAFGVAATLVAILPLHMVLVPSSLPNLTQLDLFFGTGVALLVAGSLAWVIIWSQRKPAEAQQAPGG
ncbi:MAG TPA: hypothetical protein VMU95_30070 [Trebonia sp.]|nr:hypothetical protein [Trebonia sp.]